MEAPRDYQLVPIMLANSYWNGGVHKDSHSIGHGNTEKSPKKTIAHVYGLIRRFQKGHQFLNQEWLADVKPDLNQIGKQYNAEFLWKTGKDVDKQRERSY